MTVGTKLKLKRNQLGYSQQYMAYKLNMAETTYRKIENDKTELSSERKGRIAELLGIPIEDLNQSGYIIINDDNKCESGSYVGSHVVINNNHKSAVELELENERLKKLIELKDQRIKDLEEIITLLKADK
jgi:transcriptional regulator with XRE-family HTH domain